MPFMNFPKIKKIVQKYIPKNLMLPARYYYYLVTGNLDYEIKILKKVLKNCGTAIDVGANYGIYSFAFSKKCNKVYAFEPIKECAESIVSYGKNIQVNNTALSNKNGIETLFIPTKKGNILTGHANLRKEADEEGMVVQVDIRMLDEYQFSGISIIKIDVEGHELEVLEGAKKTIASHSPIIFIEVEQRHHSKLNIDKIFRFILDCGYEGGFYFDKKFLPISKFSVEKYQLPYETDRTSNFYVNNFIFWPIKNTKDRYNLAYLSE